MTVSLGLQPQTDRGWQLLAAGRVTDALALAEQIQLGGSGSGAALHLIAEAALRAGQVAKAMSAARALVERENRSSLAWTLLARCTLASGDLSAAAEAAMRAIAPPGATAATLANAATVLSSAGRHDIALETFARATELAPDDPRHRFNLAMERRFLGDLAGAEADCDEVIARDPDHFEAWLIRSGLRRQTVDSNHIDAIRARLSRGVGSWRGEGQLLYALAKELEDIGDHARSFGVLARGASLRRAHMEYDVDRDVRLIDALIAAFAPEPEAIDAHCTTGSSAIFIVGLPRTGTTLAERILSAHSRVESLGEPTAFPAAMMAGMQKMAGQGPGAEDRIAAARAIDPAALGEGYLERLAGLRGDAPRFIDKLPMNFLNIGLIRRSLPGAKIIHLRRDPMDAGYAMLKTWFAEAYPFSYDQEELGAYIAAYDRLMTHWKALYPDAILEIEYEALVDDVEGQARLMLAYCGLDWDAACSEPHRNSAPSTTASASQVREPVYRRSIGSWRHYRSELEPLRARLAGSGLVTRGNSGIPQ